jgi:general secretion pathway protein A
MYENYFGLKAKPFTIAPNPLYLYMSRQHREALAHLVFGVQSDNGFIVITGEVGTGKTTLCRCFLEQIPKETEVCLILNPRMNAIEMLASICDELHIEHPHSETSTKVYVDLINARLLHNYAEGKKTLLIIDEAQNLSDSVLEQLRLLTNLETHDQKLLQIILIGQTAF